jgi:Fic family protein
MTGNWQQADWANVTWQRSRLARAEAEFLLGGGVFLGTIKHLDHADNNQLTVDALSVEAVTSSEIEGEILDRASVQSSIRRQLGLAADHRRVRRAEQGITKASPATATRDLADLVAKGPLVRAAGPHGSDLQ